MASVTAAASASASAVQAASASAPPGAGSAEPIASAAASGAPAASDSSDVTLDSAMGTGKGFKNETELARFALATSKKMDPDTVRSGFPSDAILDQAMTCTDPNWKLSVRQNIASTIKHGPIGSSLAVYGPVTFVSAAAGVVTTYQKDVAYRACTMKVEVSTYAITINAKDKGGKTVSLSLSAVKIGELWFLESL